MVHDDPTVTIADGAVKRREKTEPRPAAVSSMFGRYVVLEELGRGGMSVVYTAYDPKLDRRVALKVVQAEQLSEVHRARLHREAQALARLSHPSVVAVYDVGDIENDTFVAMELVNGESFRDWLKKKRTWREVVRVVVAAGRGLAAAHAAGIVHRDVKPDNIMISSSGEVKLVDFGLARDLGDRSIDSEEISSSGSSGSMSAQSSTTSISKSSRSSGQNAALPLDAITQHGFVVGTPAYMPPEQHSKKPETDERSDQFSLCASLYEALYQKRPFQTSKKQALDPREAVTVADRPGTDTRTLAAPPPKDTNVPSWLWRVLERGLAVDPNKRYPSVDALLEDLDRDPARTMRRVAVGAGALLAVAALAILVTYKVMPKHAGGPSCSTGADLVASVWSPTRAAELGKVAGHKGGAGAAGASGVVAARGDTNLADRPARRFEAGEATRVKAVQSPEALDLRMQCLDRRLTELDALVGVLQEADADALRKAGEIADRLQPLADCADVKGLRQIVKPPNEPGVAARLSQLDKDLARMQALYTIGDVTHAIPLADKLIADAKTIGYAPPLARALYWRGRSIADRDGGVDAIAMFDQTFSAALGAGDDAMAADAAARIAQEELWVAHLPEFDRWSRISRSLAQRSNQPGVVRFVDQLSCMSMHWTGKVKSRLKCLRDLAARKDGVPSEWLVTTLGIAATEAGEPAEAISWLEKGVELARADNGPDHPRTLEMRTYLCRGLEELGDYKRATEECRDALTRLQKVAPDDKTLIARLQQYLADAEKDLGNNAVAKTLYEAAALEGEDEVKLASRQQLAELAGEAKGDPKAAIAEHRAAVDELEKTYAQFNPRHPNIISGHFELGGTLLAAGDAKGALAELTKADTETDITETNLLQLAQLRFLRARAMVMAKGDRAEARKLAESALDLYKEHAPDTERFRKERAAIEKWLAESTTG